MDPLNPLSRELVEGPGDLGLSYLAFNTQRAPFNDELVRRAIHHAIDRDWLTGTVLGGAVRPVGTILPPGMPGYDQERALAHDPVQARHLLATSPLTDTMTPLVLTTAGDGGDDVVANAVADAISDTLGVRVIVEQAPWEQFQQEMTSGTYGMWVLGWSADYADPQDFLDVLFHSEAPLNASGFRDPEVDAWLEEARTVTDEGVRQDLYARAERAILQSSPWVPLYTGRSVWLVKPNVHGFTVPPLTTPRLARVWMDSP
jgi:ABC-type oligopeptide transport system substrate-binding subunit